MRQVSGFGRSRVVSNDTDRAPSLELSIFPNCASQRPSYREGNANRSCGRLETARRARAEARSHARRPRPTLPLESVLESHGQEYVGTVQSPNRRLETCTGVAENAQPVSWTQAASCAQDANAAAKDEQADAACVRRLEQQRGDCRVLSYFLRVFLLEKAPARSKERERERLLLLLLLLRALAFVCLSAYRVTIRRIRRRLLRCERVRRRPASVVKFRKVF